VVHFILIAAYGIQTIVMDAWHVIVPEIVMQRWIMACIALTVVAGAWYLAHNKNNDIPTFKRLLFLIVASDLVLASFNVYTQRGMASKAVILYALAIATAALLLNRAALYATAAFASASYVATAVTYFALHFNEGYKTELYAEITFYSAAMFVLAGIISVVVRFGGSTADS
jgi:hypothetical protein